MKVVALSVLTILLCDVTLIVHSLKQTLQTTFRDTHTTVLEIGLTAKNLRVATQSWKEASDAQAKASTDFIVKGNASLASLDAMIRKTDANVNEILLPKLSRVIEEQGNQLTLTQENLNRATIQLQKTLADADQQISNPQIQKSLDNLAEATGNANQGMVQLTAIATDGRQVADKFRSDYLKPQKFAWELLKQAIGLGGSMAQMVK